MKKGAKPARGRSKPPRPEGEAKNLAPSTATGNKGGRFENRVQATKLLALCLGGSTAGLSDDSRIVELRFQARVHGQFTDDLVCTVENASGQRSRALMQMKSGLAARRSNSAFMESVGNAWLDFHAGDFAKGSDIVLIVHDRNTNTLMRSVAEVARSAKSSLLAAEWHQKLLGPKSGNKAKREAYGLIKAACDLYAKRECSPEELMDFLAHVEFLEHDLATDTTAEYKGYLQQIQNTAPWHPNRQDPSQVWSKLVTVCMELNEIAGAIDHDNLKRFVGADLHDWFAYHRAACASPSYMPQLQDSVRAPQLATIAALTILSQASHPVMQGVEAGSMPRALESSTNKFVSSQLDHVDIRIKALQYTAALDDIEHLGKDLGPFDAHQKARWHLMRGICYWHLHDPQDAADEFIKASELYRDDDRLAAAEARAHLFRQDLPGAIAAAQTALQRFPNSLSVWLVKANAEMNNGTALFETDIPAVHRGSADALLLVAWSHMANGRKREATAVALKALALRDAGFFVADASLSIALDVAAGEGLNAAFRMFDDASRAALVTATSALEPRAEKLWGIQAPKLVATTAARLGLAYLLLGKKIDALAVYDEACARSLAGPGLLRLGIEAFAENGKTPEAIALGLRNVDAMQPDVLVAFGQLASNAGDIDAIDSALQSAAKRGLEPSAQEALQALRWDTMVLKPETSGLALQEVRAQLGEIVAGSSMALLAIAGRTLLQHGNPGEAGALIERAAQLLTQVDKPSEIYLAAMLHLQAKRFVVAAELLDRIVLPGQLSELHVFRLHALLRSGQLAKARKLVENLPPNWEANDDVRRMAVDLGQRAGDWDFLETLVAPQLARHPGAASSWNFKVYVATHRDDSNLNATVADAPEIVTGSAEEVVRLASAEIAFGDRDKALRRLYRMRRARLNDAEGAALYLAAVMTSGERLSLLHSKPDCVGPGTSVLLRDTEGKELVHTIDPEDCEVEPLTEEFHHLGSEEVGGLLGLRVGEKLVVNERLTSGQRLYEVVHIENAYQRLLSISSRATSQSLTPSKVVSIVQIKKDGDGQMDFSPLTRQLQEDSARTHQVMEIYKESPITIGCVSKMLGRDVFSVVRGWQQLAVPLYVGGGAFPEREAAVALLGGPGSRFVIDAATLTELALLDCLDCLATLPAVLVTTRTRDLVARKLVEVRDLRHEGHAFEQGGQLGFVQFTDRHRLGQVQFYEAIQRTIMRYCIVMPAYGPDDMTKLPAELHRVLSGEEYSVILLCLQENAHVLSMDARLRNLMATFGTRGAWPQALLQHALAAQAVSARDYSVACVRMFFANRSFVSLGALDLVFMAHQGSVWLAFGIDKFAGHIAEGDVDFESALRVSMQFLGMLFSSGNCQFGVVVQLLRILVNGLRRHRQAGVNLRDQIAAGLGEALAPLGEKYMAYIDPVLQDLFEASDPHPRYKLNVSVLMVADPPWIQMERDVAGAASTDVESPPSDGRQKVPETAAGEGTSAADDSR